MYPRVFIFLLLSLLTQSFTGSESRQNNPINLEGTTWLYIDEDLTYEIHFGPDGRLITTQPNDITRDNDFWEQEGGVMKFCYNDKYACYRGIIYGGDSIIGKAGNSTDTWDFKMYRLADSTTAGGLK